MGATKRFNLFYAAVGVLFCSVSTQTCTVKPVLSGLPSFKWTPAWVLKFSSYIYYESNLYLADLSIKGPATCSNIVLHQNWAILLPKSCIQHTFQVCLECIFITLLGDHLFLKACFLVQSNST